MSIRKKEKSAKFDVIVVGGGMNGLCAAVAAARHGAKTALVQDRPVLGGNASSEIRMHINGASEGSKKNAVETGILMEIQLENRRCNDYYNYSIWDRVLFDFAKNQENLTLFLNTTMCDAEAVNNHITSITCWQMSTETTWTMTADVFCDCTGNGTLGYMVGGGYRIGSEGKAQYNEPHAPEHPDNNRMGNTLLFKAVDRGVPVTFIPPKGAYKFTEEQLKYRKHADRLDQVEALATPLLDQADDSTKRLQFASYVVDFGYWWIELTGSKEDIIEEYEDIRDELVKCIYGVWDHIKNCGDHGAANYDLEWVGMLPGMRESRRQEGQYMLTENDLIANRIFDDAVAYGGWAADNHVPHGLWDFDLLPSDIFDFPGLYTIPYRSYVSRDIDNMYISGRSLGASKLAMASTRVMGTCSIGGQALGTAAALCIKHHCLPMGIMDHMKELQQTLLKDDCYIPGFRNEDAADLARKASVTASSEKAPAANVINGIARNLDDQINWWCSDGISDNEYIALQLPDAAPVHSVRLTLDPNLSKEISISVSSGHQRRKGKGIPPELLKDYDVLLLKDGREVARKEIRDNYQALNVIDFDAVEADAVKVQVISTNGLEDAHIFEIRIY